MKKGLLEAEPLKISCNKFESSEMKRSSCIGAVWSKLIPARVELEGPSAPHRSPGCF